MAEAKFDLGRYKEADPILKRLIPAPQDDQFFEELVALRGNPKALKAKLSEHQEAITRLAREQAYLERQQCAVVDVMNWIDGSLRLERAEGSKLGSLRSAIEHRDIIIFDITNKDDQQYVQPQSPEWTPFVVEHDWSAAFEKAADYANGPYTLPMAYACFEFQISGRRVLAFISDKGTDGALLLHVVMRTKAGYMMPICGYDVIGESFTARRGDKNNVQITDAYPALVALLIKQIRAICIALDARAAEAVLIRVPFDGREAKKPDSDLPSNDYHIISLANRRRRIPAVGDPAGLETARRRLHFVRGHWRHYPNRKTWVRWHFRGDPDLGFIDKHYRL